MRGVNDPLLSDRVPALLRSPTDRAAARSKDAIRRNCAKGPSAVEPERAPVRFSVKGSMHCCVPCNHRRLISLGDESSTDRQRAVPMTQLTQLNPNSAIALSQIAA